MLLYHKNLHIALLTGLPRCTGITNRCYATLSTGLLRFTRNDKGASSAKKTDYRNDTRARISVIARNEMTKQSSKNNACAVGAALLTGLPRYARNDKGAKIKE